MRPLLILLAVAAVGQLAWSAVTPPLEGPDETSHFGYVQRMVETRELPQEVEEGAYPLSTELNIASGWANLAQLPLNPDARPSSTDAEREAFERMIGPWQGARSDGTGYQAAAANPPLYYAYEALPYAAGYKGDLFLRLQLMRLWQLPLLLLVVWMTWLLCAELMPRPQWARVLACGVVALHPVLAFMAGVVNPDIGLAAVWSVLLVLAVRMLKRGPTLRMTLLLAALCAASVLIQPRGLGVGLPAAVAFVLACARHDVPLRRAVTWGAAGAFVGLLGLLGYYATIQIGGDQTSGQLEGAVTGTWSTGQFLSYVWQFYFPKLGFLQELPGDPRGWKYVYVESFFGVFGSLDVFLPPWVYDRLHDAARLGLIALLVCAGLRLGALRRHWRELLVLVAAFVALVGIFHFSAYRSLQGNDWTDPILVGRYLLPLLPLFGLAVAFIATSLPRRAGPWFAVVALCAGVLLHFAGLGQAVLRYYG